MRSLILSDIHGSAIAVRQALSFFDKFNCDKIFILGDSLYHGPRNPLPQGHGPMEVVEALRPYANKITAVRGNCDADVDLMMLDFFHIENEYAVVEDNVQGKIIRMFLSHGHIFMPECFPANALEQIEPGIPEKRPIDVYLYGHTHIYQIQKNFKNVLMVNPGSTSLPKGGNPSTFAFYENGKFSIHKLEDGTKLDEADLMTNL